jgi:Zn-dependent protease
MKILGIKVEIHWSMWVLLVFMALTKIMNGGTVEQGLFLATLVGVMFFFVLLHEFGHALAARKFGIGTRSIVLYPMGGIASLERVPRDPSQEFWVAVAGPAVNVVLAVLFYVASKFVATDMMMWFVQANTVLVLFNMLPAFPMDGGRVFRSLLASRMDYVKATSIAAKVAKVMAVLFGVYGIASNNFMLIIIGLFVYMASESEYQQVVRDESKGYDI